MAASAPSWLPGAEGPSRDLFSTLGQRLLTTLHADGAAVAVLQEGEMRCCARAGHVAPVLGAVLDTASGISGRCVREGRALRCYDTELDPRVDRLASQRLGVRSLAIAPLRHGAEVVGIVEVFSKDVGHFDEPSLRTLERVAIDVSARAFAADSAPELQSVQRSTTVSSRPGPQLLVRPKAEATKRELRAPATGDTSSAEAMQLFAGIGQSPSRQWSRPWKLAGTLAVLLICSAGAILAARVYLGRASHPSSLQAENDVSPEIRAIAVRARSGDASAQRSFADYYAGRQGSGKNLVKAATWYVVAGIGGDQRARESATEITRNLQPFEIAQVQFNVGKMFASGLGVPRDQVSAYAWFLLAQAAGDVRADVELAKLSQTMTAEESATARQRASEWLAQNH